MLLFEELRRLLGADRAHELASACLLLLPVTTRIPLPSSKLAAPLGDVVRRPETGLEFELVVEQG